MSAAFYMYVDFVVVPFLLEKHSIYGLDEVLSLIPEETPGLLVCIRRSDNALGEYDRVLWNTVLKNIAADDGEFTTVPMLMRIRKNLAQRRRFDYGLKDSERLAFDEIFSRITAVMGQEKPA